MESMRLCYCCLLRPSDQHLKTPYIQFGKTEIFADMLIECFEIHLTLDYEECGICEACVGRLRDARDFKLQVQRSQVELQARREGVLRVKAIDLPVSNVCKQEKLQPALSERRVAGNCVDDPPDLSQICHTTVASSPTSVTRAQTKRESESKNKIHDNTSIKETYYNRGKQKQKSLKCVVNRVKIYTCEVCEKQFKHKCHYVDHMRIHTGQKPYGCDVCDKRFAQKTAMKVHKRVHTGEKPYGCEICGRRFAQTSGLYSHKLIHDEEKTYSCHVCHKKFKQKSTLNCHKRVHTRPYPCEQCEKQFAEQSSLNRHKIVHIGEYTCKICDKKFTELTRFNDHKKKHVTVKLHTCEACYRQFKRKAHLDRHKKNNAQRKLSCEICGQQFNEKCAFKIHKVTHLRSDQTDANNK